MNKKMILLLLATTWVFASCSGRSAQKDVVTYLEEKFRQQNIPVTEIIVLQETPLQLQIIIQSVDDHITPEDSINLHKVDREVFIIARKNDYKIERYTRILQDSQGKQLYKLDQGATDIQEAIANGNSSGLGDNDVKKILSDSINSLATELHIQKTKIKLDVSSADGVQTLEAEFTTPSLDEAYYVFGFLQSRLIFPMDGLIADVNAQGGQIVMCTYRIVDDSNNLLFFYFFDYQLQRGTWSNADTFQVDLGEGPPQSQ